MMIAKINPAHEIKNNEDILFRLFKDIAHKKKKMELHNINPKQYDQTNNEKQNNG